MTTPEIIDLEAILCEDDRTILLVGYTADPDRDQVQSIELPIAIERRHFLAEEWHQAVRPGDWRLLCG